MGDVPGAGLPASILEDQDVLQTLVLLQIYDPRLVGAQDLFHLFQAGVVKILTVMRRLDDHLVGPDAVHQVEQAQAPPTQLLVGAQYRTDIGDTPDEPSRGIGICALVSVRENLRGGMILAALAEGAVLPVAVGVDRLSIRQVTIPIETDYTPSARDGILAQLSHPIPPPAHSLWPAQNVVLPPKGGS